MRWSILLKDRLFVQQNKPVFLFCICYRQLSPGDAMISRPIKNLEINKLNENGEY